MISKKISMLIDLHEGGNKRRFALKIGLKSSGLVHDWLSGRARPKIEYQNKICEAYGVTREWLNSADDSPPLSALHMCAVAGDNSTIKDLKFQVLQLEEKIKRLEEQNRSQQETIHNLSESIKTLSAQKGVSNINSGIHSKR